MLLELWCLNIENGYPNQLPPKWVLGVSVASVLLVHLLSFLLLSAILKLRTLSLKLGTPLGDRPQLLGTPT